MAARDTSIQSYRALRDSGEIAQQEFSILLNVAALSRPVSRSEISRYSGIAINAVSGRVNGLIKKGHLAELPQSPCPITGRMVHKVEISNA